MNLSQQTIAYCLIWGLEIDIGGIIFSDLVNKLQNGKKNKELNICYTRFLSLMFENLLGKDYVSNDLTIVKPHTITTASFQKPLASEVPLTLHMLKHVTQSKAIIDLKTKKKKIPPSSKPKSPYKVRVILLKKQVVETHVKVTVAIDVATKSLEASELAEEQGNQLSTTEAKKVLDQNVEKDAEFMAMDEKVPYDTESEIKEVKSFFNSHIFELKDQTMHDSEEIADFHEGSDSDLQLMPDDDLMMFHDMVSLLKSAKVFKKANAEGEKWEKNNLLKKKMLNTLIKSKGSKSQGKRMEDDSDNDDLDKHPLSKRFKIMTPIPNPIPVNTFVLKDVLKPEEQHKSLHDFTNQLFGTTSSKFSPTPLREPTPPRDPAKGKEVVIVKEQVNEHVTYQEEGGYVPKMPKLKSFITSEGTLSLEEYNNQIKELKRITDPLLITTISYVVNSNKEATMKITRGENPLNLIVHPSFRLNSLGFSEWLEVHALACKKTGKSNDMLLQSVKAKFQWVMDQAKKLGLSPPQSRWDEQKSDSFTWGRANRRPCHQRTCVRNLLHE
ncbi:hypothetical protein Tco_0765343 [Tanacetum coccineum]